MKNRFIVFILIVMVGGLAACDYFRSDISRFQETYRKVLINRELQTDSLTAYRKMLEILDDDGFNIDTFQKVYMELAKHRPDEFMKMLDTMRQSVAKEIIERRKESNK